MRKIAVVVLVSVFLVPAAVSQSRGQIPQIGRVPAQIDAEAIHLYEDAAPGPEAATANEVWTVVGGERWARNVVRPTLLPVLPAEENSTGAAVIVVPGGGFQFVSMDNEGYLIANWLAERGVAAFILKYRVMETPDDEQAFIAHMQKRLSSAEHGGSLDMASGKALAVADAQEALRIVETRSEEWGIDPDRIGMLGFSAGAIATLGVVMAEGNGPYPDFLGYIYGPMKHISVPEHAPPIFVALAADDAHFGDEGFGLVEAWKSSGVPVEFHLYQSGGHGFGSYRRGFTADGWFDQYIDWLASRGLLAGAPPD